MLQYTTNSNYYSKDIAAIQSLLVLHDIEEGGAF